jgi:hypothetical protein
MKKGFATVALCLLVTAVSLPAQQDSDMQIRGEFQNPNAMLYGIGAQAGLLSGSGFLFRTHFPSRVGAQVAFGVIKLGDNTYWDVGGEVQYSFDANVDNHIYGFIGGGYYYASTQDSSSENELDGPGRVGFGVGYEWFVSRSSVLNITLPLTFFLGDKTEILPIPQLAFVYYFR